MTPQLKATSTSAPGRTPCVRGCMCVGVCLCTSTKETGNLCDCLCFGDKRWSHLDCISGPTLESPWLYISTHSGHDGFMWVHTTSCAVYAGPQVEAHQFREINLVGVVSSIISGQKYVDIYIQIHI